MHRDKKKFARTTGAELSKDRKRPSRTPPPSLPKVHELTKEDSPMPRKINAHNTMTADAVNVSDTDLQVLQNIVTSWNISKAADKPDWTPTSVLAELAAQKLEELAADYGTEPRKPDHVVHLTPPPPTE